MPRTRLQRWLTAAALALLAAMLLAPPPACAAAEGRKVKVKVTPTFPSLARQMNLNGTVRIEVVIAPNGEIKSTRALGGHPLLIEAATEALRKWKYEPGPETTTIVEFHFSAQN